MIKLADAERLLGPKHLKFVQDFTKNHGEQKSFSNQLMDRLASDHEARARIESFGLDLKYFTYLCEYWFVM